MASKAIASGADEPEEREPSRQPPPQRDARRSASGAGFFHIYKKGQGKWTRLGTVFGAVLIGILTAFNIFYYLQPYVHNRRVLMGISAGFLVLFALLVQYIINKPTNADFLIATDSEMKKVNWTTKGELYGSTKVVVLFIIFIAIFLFAADIVFSEIFHLIGVLLSGPF